MCSVNWIINNKTLLIVDSFRVSTNVKLQSYAPSFIVFVIPPNKTSLDNKSVICFSYMMRVLRGVKIQSKMASGIPVVSSFAA